MDTIAILDELTYRAHRNKALKEKFLETRNAENPLKEFCRVAQEEGFFLTQMDIVEAGEDFHASMKRSTNGGGENSPMLDYQDDFYLMFLESLENGSLSD